ncbi:ATP-dependent DNA helicase chl1 [Desmophyllum pertusum]|uniref:ATP-dependent DNA helicase chl1 n=1 Tax=Desmophyllum pertusum TaxID=174260 RepID=A0A9W9Z9Z9_9CNID|nr:ATP-dependent DNA helicase chl1 [Desmophyllum pertusum]
MYNFGVGGGWTHEFKVLYRKKVEGEEFQETDWVDHFRVQWTEINDLEPELYEFKTIGKNAVGTSPESDVTEAISAEKSAAVSGKRDSSQMYESDWFITLIILSAGVLLLLLIVVVVRRCRRRRSSNFKVSEHEKEIEIPTPIDFKPREDWKTRLERLEEVDRESHDSLDEYGGEGAYFH